MTLKEDLLKIGYLPENLPPPFHTEDIAKYFVDNPSGYLTDKKKPLRSAVYSSSKRGISRRTFSAVHPVTAHDLAEFLGVRAPELDELFKGNKGSFSIPKHTPDGDRSLEIPSHTQLEMERLTRLSGYRFVAKTDISRFYHSIYTHSIPWAFHGKAEAKKNRKHDAADIYFNRLDFILRQGQDGQTIGIPVGPDASRYIAELICNAVDASFIDRCASDDVVFIRHVDDVWIGAQSYVDAERALWAYRSCLREFELDINESKTNIYAANFRFTDSWPSEVAFRIELAVSAAEHRRDERLRAALEYAFDLSVSKSDEGILKYAIRQLDLSDHLWDEWPVLQPFLMRSAIHFGHTLDYVVRVLVWRRLTKNDVHDERWEKIIRSLLNHHGRIGNDSEVCWLVFAAISLGVSIPTDIACTIVRNCGALSIVAILNHCTEDKELFDAAFEVISADSATGAMWPVFLEWAGTGWYKSAKVCDLVNNDVVAEMAARNVFIFDPKRLTRVFKGVEPSKFTDIIHAIESRMSSYDDAEAEAV